MKPETQMFNVVFTGRAINFDTSPSFYTAQLTADIAIPARVDAPQAKALLENCARQLYLTNISEYVRRFQDSPLSAHKVKTEVELLTKFNWRPEITLNSVSVLS